MTFRRKTQTERVTEAYNKSIEKMLDMEDAAFSRLLDNVIALPRTRSNMVTQRLVQIAAIRRVGA